MASEIILKSNRKEMREKTRGKEYKERCTGERGDGTKEEKKGEEVDGNEDKLEETRIEN